MGPFFLWESRREDCVPCSIQRGDTLVQYAACLFGFVFFFPFGLEEIFRVAQFDSDYSGGEGASLHLFFAGM